MSHEKKKLMIYFRRRLSSALLLVILLPILTYSAELIHTIQIGSHLVEHRAERQYGAVLAMLQEEERGYLRIEKIDGYYALRLGKFTTPRDAEGLLQKINTVYPGAEMMRAYVSNNKLVKIYRPAAIEEPTQGRAEKSAPTFLELQEESAPILEEKQMADQQVDVEASSSAIPELKQDPPGVTMIVAPQVAVAERVPVPLELQEQPPVSSVETAERPLPVEVAEPVADLTVAVKLPDLPVSVATSVKSMVVAEPSAAVVGESRQTIAFRQKIIFAFVLILIVLTLFVRTRKTVKPASPTDAAFEGEQSADTAAGQHIAVSGVEQAVGCAAAAEAAPSDFSSDDLAGDKKESLISILRESRRIEPVEKTAAVAEPCAVQLTPNEVVPAVVKTVTTDIHVNELPDTKAAKPSKEERQNRVSRAMEAAVSGKEKNK